jgi:hypothetical protein
LIDLQDATLRGAQFDEEAGRVSLEVRLATKNAVCLVFEGVRPSPHIAPMLALRGSILDWKPATGPGNTHIYLMDGVITLWAQRLSVK